MAQLTPISLSGFVAGNQATATSWITNLTVPQTGVYYLTFELGSACIVQMSVDGTNFYNMNGGVAFNAGWNTVVIELNNGDTFNLQQSSGGNIAVNVLRLEF